MELNKDNILQQIISGFGFIRIAYHYSPQSRWVYANKIEEYDKEISYNHRNILPNEVVFDLDLDSKEDNNALFKKIIFNLSKNNIKYSTWQTGGKGFHIHTFWTNMGKASNNKLIKTKVFEWLVEDLKGFDRQLLGTHMIRMEWGKYEKAYPKEAFKLPIDAKMHFVQNEIPEHIWKEYNVEVLRSTIDSFTHKKSSTKGLPECLNYFISGEFKKHKEGTKRALFIVASHYRNLPDNELISLLKTFNQYNLRTPYNDHMLKSVISSVRNHKGRPVGCSFRHELLKEIGAKEVIDKCEQQKKGDASCLQEKTKIVT